MAETISCKKYLVFFFNLLFTVTGALIIVCGVLMYRSDLKYGLSTQTGSHVALMIIGAIIFVVAFCGCCGAIRENSFLIGAFSISLVLLIVIEISIGIFIYSNENKAKEYIIDGIKIEFEEYNNRTNLIAFNALQEDFECCGINGPGDYEPIWKNSSLPATCCPRTVNVCDNNSSEKYTVGCKDAFFKWFGQNVVIVAGIVIGIGLIQLLGLSYACCLYKAFRSEYEVV